MNSQLNKCKKRKNDIIYTPKDLAVNIIKSINIKKDDFLLDPFFGEGVFYNNFPNENKKDFCEIEKPHEKNFFEYNKNVDWIISNPPFSKLTLVLEKCTKICNKGFCFIILSTALSVKRLNYLESECFFLTKISIVEVKSWFGFNCLVVVFEKNKSSILELKPKKF